MSQEALQLEFANGTYNFRLTLAGIKEIQDRCNAGIGEVWARLHAARLNFIGEDVGVPNNLQTGESARWRVEDIIEPIRQGLLGGGEGEADGEVVKVNPIVANRLIETYVLTQPLQNAWSIAFAIVGALVEGYDPPKKKVADDPQAEDGSTTPQP